MPLLNRRVFVGCSLAGLAPRPASAAGLSVAALFAGRIDDRGFMQAGYEGLKRAETRFGAITSSIDGIKPEKDLLAGALRALAETRPDLVIAHGGQNNEAAQQVAAAFPDIRFVVTQGNVTGPNLASYDVLQEQSTFLAGMLAGLTTKSGVVGHMSGIRVVPGLKGRAAFAHGLAYTNPKARLLTNFSGNQDDNALSRKIAGAMIDQGADIIFTMLNAGRQGAIDVCRERKVAQIGNVGDWTQMVPDVFVASAFADVGQALVQAVDDITNNRFEAGVIRKVTLSSSDALRLTMAGNVPSTVRERINIATQEIAAGRLDVPTTWSGPEFANPA